MQRKPTIKVTHGATVLYCGHAGYFYADMYAINGAIAVHAAGPVSPASIARDQKGIEGASHHLSDFPIPGLWDPRRGVFVVPSNQVTARHQKRKSHAA